MEASRCAAVDAALVAAVATERAGYDRAEPPQTHLFSRSFASAALPTSFRGLIASDFS